MVNRMLNSKKCMLKNLAQTSQKNNLNSTEKGNIAYSKKNVLCPCRKATEVLEGKWVWGWREQYVSSLMTLCCLELGVAVFDEL